MGWRRQCGLIATGHALALAAALVGCSSEPPLELDKGVSPFGPAADPPPASIAAADLERAQSTSGPLDSSLGTNDIERTLRLAMSLGDRGELSKSGELLDRVLAVEPVNREALYMRGVLALEQARRAGTDSAARDEAIARAKESAATLERAYEGAKPHEIMLQSRVKLAEAIALASAGKIKESVAVLRMASGAGLDTIERGKNLPELEQVWKSPEFKALQAAIDQDKLVRARAMTKEILAKSADFVFDFKLPDLDRKPVALAGLKGKVVIVDFWGTWCGPCIKAVPLLAELYKEKHAAGLEIVGIAYERNTASDDEARQNVSKFVKQNAVPYINLIGDEPTITKIPGFKGFPTTLVLDRSGKVRLLVTENNESTFELVRSVVSVLLTDGDDAGKPKPVPGAAKAANPPTTGVGQPARTGPKGG